MSDVFTDPTSDQPGVSIPKLAFPFRMSRIGNRFGAAQVDQDTNEEIAASVFVVLATERGDREDDPEYGLDDPTFIGVDLEELREVVADGEPRAELLSDEELNGLVQEVTVRVL
jgi:hypothetical protein